MEGLLGFILAGISLAGSPGPNTLSLAAAGAAFGAKRSGNYLVGLVVGMDAVMAVTAAGLVALVLSVPGATPLVTAAAAAYFVYLAYRIATAPPLGADGAAGDAPTFLAGFLLSMVNPKGYAAMAALFSGFELARGDRLMDALLKIMVLTGVIVAVNVAWLLAGSALTRAFRDPRLSRAINIAFAILLIASVAFATLL